MRSVCLLLWVCIRRFLSAASAAENLFRAGFQLTVGSMLGALVIGFLALPAAKIIKTPAECISFPALLPMVPGMYAYRTIQSLLHCLGSFSEPTFMHYLYLLRFNWMTCMVTIIAMVVGVMLPILLFQNFSFKVTK